MNSKTAAAAIFSIAFIILTTHGQQTDDPLDEYIDSAKTIFIGKCINVGPVNILLRSNVELDVIHMVKGDGKIKTVTVVSQYGMEAGKTYLVRTVGDDKTLSVRTRDSVIQVWENEDIPLLKTLSPRIVVLRTMNHRIDELDSLIRISSYELDALKAVKKDN